MQNELKPCPFCGSNNLSIESIFMTNCPDRFCWIRCNNCTAEIKEPKLRDEAIEAWNRRITDGRTYKASWT